MQTELLTVSRIFNESLFRIPDFQRGYSWGEEQLQDFWNDLIQLGEGKDHYTGVLTFEIVSSENWEKWEDDIWLIKSRKFKPYYVVDGQQRLTTISILISVLAKNTNYEILNDTPKDEIIKKYLVTKRPNSTEQTFIFGYEKDNPSYEFLKNNVFEECSSQHYPEEKTIYTRNLEYAKKFFINKIENLDEATINIIFTKLTQNIVFNAYEISKEIDVFVAFETMNNRGKQLSTLELLKNRLIYLVVTFFEPQDSKLLRKKINEVWKSIYYYIGRSEDRQLNDDSFLETHTTYYYHHLLNINNKIDFKDEDKVRFFLVFPGSSLSI